MSQEEPAALTALRCSVAANRIGPQNAVRGIGRGATGQGAGR
jgi:hypothetical protein